MSLFFFRNNYNLYNGEMKAGQPKPYGMVEREARSRKLIEDGHHDLETGLRNKSGKV